MFPQSFPVSFLCSESGVSAALRALFENIPKVESITKSLELLRKSKPFGTWGPFRTFEIIAKFSEFFYTWRAAIFRKRSTWCPDRNRDLVLETYVSMLERKIFSNDLRVRYHRNLS